MSVRTPSVGERIGFLDDEDDQDGRRDLSLSPSSSAETYVNDDIEAWPLNPLHKYQPSLGHRSLISWLRPRPRHLRRFLRKHHGCFLLPLLKYLVIAVAILLVATPVIAPSYTRPPPHYGALESRCQGSEAESGCANPFKEKVFISVSLYDASGHLAGGRWGDSILELIHMIGQDNVFLSIYENDSGQLGASALETLKAKLRCKYAIVNDHHVPKDDFPTIELPDGSSHIKRLAYLSEMRNRALRPLDTLDPDRGIVHFDRVLFMNDVAFRPIDAAHLLFSTNVGPDGRAHYLTTCGLDYMQPLLYYDLYASRDAEGFSMGLPLYPIFSNAGKGQSRAAMLAQKDAVPVSSCWGGMVAMDARYVQNQNQTLPRPDFQDIGSHVIQPAEPTNVTSPVRFRYEPEIFYDACECCLFLADVQQVASGDGAKDQGTYVNPYIRVAYDYDTLGWLPWVKRWERLFSIPQALLTPMAHLPTHNPHRALKEGDVFQEEVWTGHGDQGHWEMVERTARNGMFCGVREMQTILAGDRDDDVNWENNPIPAGQALNFPS